VASLAALLDQLYEGDIVDIADVARVSGSHPRSVARWRSPEGAARRDSEERLLELKAVVDLLRRVVREDAARLWLRAPNPELGYEKPLELIGAGRYERVIDLLLAMAEGVTA
jgi:putative toxin-antitoxin system antitoxin component (TIGR02293 family)